MCWLIGSFPREGIFQYKAEKSQKINIFVFSIFLNGDFSFDQQSQERGRAGFPYPIIWNDPIIWAIVVYEAHCVQDRQSGLRRIWTRAIQDAYQSNIGALDHSALLKAVIVPLYP